MTEFHFSSKISVDKGWSEDKKFQVTMENGEKALLRISPAERYEQRKTLFSLLHEVMRQDVPMCEPLAFGVCGGEVHTLFTWIDGEDAEDAIPLLPVEKQYALGWKAGELLRRIHSVPAPKTQEDWYIRFNRKVSAKIEAYRACPLRFDGDEKMIRFIEENRALLKNRPQCFQHGDYHTGNMMMRSGELVIIDFDRFDFGDPWEEFNRIVWCAQLSPAFASGQIDGYFDGIPPRAFFDLLAFYIAGNTLSSVYWAIPFGQKEIDTMMKQTQDVLSWYNDMTDTIPSWYHAGLRPCLSK